MRRWLVLLAGAALTAAGCGDSDTQASVTGPAATAAEVTDGGVVGESTTTALAETSVTAASTVPAGSGAGGLPVSGEGLVAEDFVDETVAVVIRDGGSGLSFEAVPVPVGVDFEAFAAELATTDGVLEVEPLIWFLPQHSQPATGLMGITPSRSVDPAAEEDLGPGGEGGVGVGRPVVAVLDTGVDAGHELLLGRVVEVIDFAVVRPGVVDDPAGFHGTAVASVVAQVAPGVDIISVRIASETAASGSASIANGILAAIDAGADVINLSWGGPTTSKAVVTAIDAARIEGIVVVVAAGNSGDTDCDPRFSALNEVIYPAALPATVAVGGSEGSEPWRCSQEHDFVDLAAPAVAVQVADPVGGTVEVDGTSVAAPAVAGAIGQLMATNPALTAEAAARIVVATTITLNETTHTTLPGNQHALELAAAVETATTGTQDVAIVIGWDGIEWNDLDAAGNVVTATTSIDAAGTITIDHIGGTITGTLTAIGFDARDCIWTGPLPLVGTAPHPDDPRGLTIDIDVDFTITADEPDALACEGESLIGFLYGTAPATALDGPVSLVGVTTQPGPLATGNGPIGLLTNATITINL